MPASVIGGFLANIVGGRRDMADDAGGLEDGLAVLRPVIDLHREERRRRAAPRRGSAPSGRSERPSGRRYPAPSSPAWSAQPKCRPVRGLPCPPIPRPERRRHRSRWRNRGCGRRAIRRSVERASVTWLAPSGSSVWVTKRSFDVYPVHAEPVNSSTSRPETVAISAPSALSRSEMS